MGYQDVRQTSKSITDGIEEEGDKRQWEDLGRRVILMESRMRHVRMSWGSSYYARPVALHTFSAHTILGGCRASDSSLLL